MFSSYLQFSRKEWRYFRQNTPLTLDKEDLPALQGINESVSLLEVQEIYLPLSRLLNLYVVATQSLHQITNEFLMKPDLKSPFFIGIAGSVAVGKSTISRILQALLSRWPAHPNVSIISTDSFLYPLVELERRNLLSRKGFPESYDTNKLLNFLNALKSGDSPLFVPVYSHNIYDIVPDEYIEINKSDIVIIEGLNILQVSAINNSAFISDYLDFSIFVDADTSSIKTWFIERVLQLKNHAFQDPKAYFHYISRMTTEEAIHFSERIWQEVNERNLLENILPFKQRSRLILYKDAFHQVQKIYLRKL